MKSYVDCVSGVDHLVSMSNKRYNELNGPHREETTDKDPQMQVLAEFSKCYFNGCVPSVCGRRIIETSVLIENINTTYKNLKTKLSSYYVNKILKAAFEGITDNCASSDQSDSYKPAKGKAK